MPYHTAHTVSNTLVLKRKADILSISYDMTFPFISDTVIFLLTNVK